jgi:hypothetical protein
MPVQEGVFLVIKISGQKGGDYMCDFDGGDDGFWDLDAGDFAILGGIFGYAEEECEETMRVEREAEKDQEEADRFNNGEYDEFDCCDEFDDDPYP